MLFKDKNTQAQLEENGYVIIPFLNSTELETLNSFYTTVHGNEEPPLFIDNIHMTSWCESPQYKQEIASGLSNLFKPATDRYFANARTLNNVFIIKKSGPKTTFKVHQDWNVIDENNYQSVNVWVPLHDVNEQTGALWILKGSHKINRKIRGAGYLFPEYSEFEEQLQKQAISVSLKAGEAIVFYHSVIHGSPPNQSGKNRIAACFSVIPKEAPLCIYFQNGEKGNLEMHQPEDNFMYQYKHLRTDTLTIPPSTKPVWVKDPFVNQKITLQELNVFLNTKRGFFARLFNK